MQKINPSFVCPVCPKNFYSLEAFQEHGFASHAVCFKCGEWFLSSAEFEQHFRKNHLATWRDGIWAGVACNCGQCGKQIASIEEMNNTAFNYDKDMEIVTRLRMHLQQNHFLCPVCTEKAESAWIKTKQGWHTHITLKHSGQSSRRYASL